MRFVTRALVAACLLPGGFAGLLASGRYVPAAPACRIDAADQRLEPLDVERKSAAVVLLRMGGRRTIGFVADTDADAVVAFDPGTGKILGRTAIAGAPSHLLAHTSERGTQLYVTARDANVIRVFDVNAQGLGCGAEPILTPVAELPTATEPVAMALTPDSSTLLVASGWGHKLEVFATRTRARLFATDVPREPRAVVVDRTGTKAFVSHAVGSGVSVIDLGANEAPSVAHSGVLRAHGAEAPSVAHSARAMPIDGKEGALTETRNGSIDGRPLGVGLGLGFIGFGWSFDSESFGSGAGRDVPPVARPKPLLPGPRSATQGFAIAALPGRRPDSPERILVPEVLVRTSSAPSTNDPKKDPPRPTGYGSFGGDEPTFGPASGHIAAFDAITEKAVETSMVLTVQDTSCLLPRAAALDVRRRSVLVACLGTNEVDEYDGDAPSPAVALRGRWKVPAGPTGLALDGDRIVVWSAFDRIVTIIGREGALDHLALTDERPPTPFEVGRKIFHASTNPAISSDGRACASCHPDGRDDGLTWSSPDGPRQTPMLAGRLAETAPFGWTGASTTVHDHLGQTLRRLEGRGLNDKATYALLTYLARMKTPHRRDAPDGARVARGKAIFESYETGCTSCHSMREGKPIGDGDTHDVGSGARGDVTASFATPSLQFVSGTGPYFHDGRYATLTDLLRATDGAMGNTAHLGPADLEAPTTYLETL